MKSTRRFANELESSQVDALLDVVMNESNMRLRTPASHALGALNLPAPKTRQTILRFHRG